MMVNLCEGEIHRRFIDRIGDLIDAVENLSHPLDDRKADFGADASRRMRALISIRGSRKSAHVGNAAQYHRALAWTLSAR